MKNNPTFRLCVLLASSLWLNAAAQSDQRTALDDYVNKSDPSYQYRLVNTLKAENHTDFVLEMVSQTWLTTNEVNQPVWKHWLTIIKPDKIAHHRALLFIAGGSNDKPAPKSIDANLARIACDTQSIVAELRMVPNQPLIFIGDNKPRVEDELIAYTWDKFLRTGDPKWPARLPMTKSAVRAMDTITTFCSSPAGGSLKIGEFVVAGGSKRGWTTWTTAAVDKRVIAIVPCVIDLLNIEPSFLHHYAAYGFWAPAVGNYTALRIMDWTGTPEYHALMKIEEPFEYRQRLTMPKFIINATGDQFFLPDSSQFYFKDLVGPKYVRYVPNTDHSLKNSDAFQTLLACYQAILVNAALPQFTWAVEKDLGIIVQTETQPREVKLWQATNPAARDFRLETVGPIWRSAPIQEQRKGVYFGKVAPPEKGWSAFFVELTFPSAGSVPFKFTTQVQVVPDVLPFKFEPNHNILHSN